MLQLVEGFDHFSGGDRFTSGAWPTLLAKKGWVQIHNTGDSQGAELVAGRMDGRCFVYATGTGGLHHRNQTYKVLPATLTELAFGVAINVSSFVGAADLVALQTSGGGLVLSIVPTVGGNIVVRGPSGTGILTGSTVIATLNWHYVEVYLKIVGTTWTVSTRVDGVTDIPPTSLTVSSTSVRQIALIGDRNVMPDSTEYKFDDLYVTDASSPNALLLGDSHVRTIYPIADGAHTGLTPNAGTTHWTQVDETSPDDDGTYVGSDVVGNRDSYDYQTLLPGADVKGVQVNLYARKTDAGTRTVAPVVRSAGTSYVGAAQPLSTSYIDRTAIYDIDPADGAWTIASVNAAEFGAEVG